ncbi:polymer-forming cytoskeletal protein [bacterium]|nr:polymer-forming cytoskeletal protein [bacterium]
MKSNDDFTRGGELNTIIGKGTVVEGDMRVQKSVRIDGAVTGNVEATETVVVGRDGEIDGQVEAANLMTAGRIKGNVTVSGKIYMEAEASIAGDIKASRLVVDDGAQFDGKCSMSAGGASAAGRTDAKNVK